MAGLSTRSGHGLLHLPDGRAARSAAGWALHHRVDEVFHELDVFREGVHALRTDLRATPLETGARRAVAHVGWELLLDDTLAADEPTVGSFRVALALGSRSIDDPAWRALSARLLAVHPHERSTTRAIAERVHRAVGRRPRLAFDAGHLDAVTDVLANHRDGIDAAALEIVAQVTDATQGGSG
jgi:hypothetical protein